MRQKARGKGKPPPAALPVSGQLPPSCLGATSEAFADALADFVRTDPEQALAGSAAAARGKARLSERLAHVCMQVDAGAAVQKHFQHPHSLASCPKDAREGSASTCA